MRLGVDIYAGMRRGSRFTPVDPPQLGPMDVVIPGRDVFTNFSREFNLAAPDAVFYLACHYTGNPVIQIAHGGEPLEILKQDRHNPTGLLSLVAIGRGLTVEAANLTITATGGTLDGGGCRIDEFVDMQTPASGWTYGAFGEGNAPPVVVGADTGGLLKAVYARRFVDTSRSIGIGGLETKFNGYTLSGDEIPYDVSVNSGNWVLGEGWSIVGDSLVRTGEGTSLCILTLPTPRTGPQGRRAFMECGPRSSGYLGNTNATNNGIGMSWPRSGYICTGATGSLDVFAISGTRDVVVRDIQWFENMDPISWSFSSGPCVEDQELTFYNYLAPKWTISMAQVFAEAY